MTFSIPRVLRFSIAAAILAMLAILFLRGRDPSFLSRHQPSPAEKALGCVIERVQLQGIPFDWAVAELGRRAGISIEVDPMVAAAGSKTHSVSFVADHVMLAEALQEVVGEFPAHQLRYVAQGDRIRIVDIRASPPPAYVEEYLVRDYAGTSKALPAKLRRAGSGFTHPSAFYLLVQDNTWRQAMAWLWWDSEDVRRIELGSDRYLLVAAAASHQRLRQVIEALRPGAAPASRRALPVGTELYDFVGGSFRSRDSFPADEMLRKMLPSVMLPRQPLNLAIVALGKQQGVRIAIQGLTIGYPQEVRLDERNVTLADAIDSLLYQAGDAYGDVHGNDDTIYVTSHTSSTFRIYDLDSVATATPQAEWETRMDQIIELAQIGDAVTAMFLGSKLIVVANWENHEHIKSELETCLRKFVESSTTQPVR